MPLAAVNMVLPDILVSLQEFMRVGYYVSTDYWEEKYREMETPPNPPLIDKYAWPCAHGSHTFTQLYNNT